MRGLTGTVDGTGNAVLYGTTGVGSSANTLISVTDTGAGAGATTIATAGTSQVFRGVELLIVPEPSVGALAGFGLLALTLFRRFRR